MKKNLAILMFDQVEVLDFAGPFEVFSVANELHDYGLFNVLTVSIDGKDVRAVNGLRVGVDCSFASCPDDIHYLVIPGGDGTKAIFQLPEYQRWVKQRYQQAEQVLTVCSGTRLLASMGLLSGKQFCTHQEVYPQLVALAPDAFPQSHLRYVRAGKLLSAGGISAGIDAALDLLKDITSAKVANKTATYMEYHRNSADCGMDFGRD